jgi:hypothetical protein
MNFHFVNIPLSFQERGKGAYRDLTPAFGHPSPTGRGGMKTATILGAIRVVSFLKNIQKASLECKRHKSYILQIIKQETCHEYA